jgi:chromosome segregation ATPase
VGPRMTDIMDGDEIETAFETVTAGLLRDRLRRASGPSWITPPHRELDAPFAALATIHRTMEGLRAERDELAYRVSFLENMYLERRTDHAEAREATSRAEQAEAERDALRLTARQNKWYAERRDEDVSRLTRQLDEMESDYEDLRSSALKHDRETSAIHGDMLALGRALGVPYDGQKSPAGYLHADIMPALREATSRAEQAERERDRLAAANAAGEKMGWTGEQDMHRLADRAEQAEAALRRLVEAAEADYRPHLSRGRRTREAIDIARAALSRTSSPDTPETVAEEGGT